jgi:hypothetical protein
MDFFFFNRFRLLGGIWMVLEKGSGTKLLLVLTTQFKLC